MCCQLYQVGTILGVAMFIRFEEIKTLNSQN